MKEISRKEFQAIKLAVTYLLAHYFDDHKQEHHDFLSILDEEINDANSTTAGQDRADVLLLLRKLVRSASLSKPDFGPAQSPTSEN